MSGVNVDLGMRAVNQTGTAFKQVRSDMQKMRTEQHAMGRSMKRSRRVVQQAGMQISDFAVQVGGGQSAILAFTQNAPQFIQQFGAIGGVMAAVVTIGGVLTLIWSRSRKAAKSLADSLTGLATAATAYRTAASAASATTAELLNMFGGTANTTVAMRAILRDLAMIEKTRAHVAIDAASTSLTNMATATGIFGHEMTTMLRLLGRSETSIDSVRKSNIKLAQTFKVGIDNVIAADTNIKRLSAAQDLRANFLHVAGAIGQMNTEQLTFLEGLNTLILESRKLVPIFDDIAKSFTSIKTMQLESDLASYGAGRKAFNEGRGKSLPKSTGSGGGGSDKAASELARVTKAYRTLMGSMNPAEASAQKFAKSQQTINDALKMGVINSVQAAAAFAQLEYATSGLKGVMDGFGAGLDGVFDRMIDGTMTAAEAFRDMANSMIADIARIIFQKNISGPLGNMLSDVIGSAFGGGGMFSDLFRAAGGPVASGSPYIVGERGPEMFVPGSSGSIVSNRTLGNGGGGGAPVTLIVNNNTGEGADVGFTQNGNTLEVTLAKRIATDIATGGPTFNAIRRTFNLRPALTGR